MGDQACWSRSNDRAEDPGGARVGKLRWERILAITGGCSMAAMILSKRERCRNYDALIRLAFIFPVQPLSQAGSAQRLVLLNKLRGISPLSGKHELAQRFALPRREIALFEVVREGHGIP